MRIRFYPLSIMVGFIGNALRRHQIELLSNLQRYHQGRARADGHLRVWKGSLGLLSGGRLMIDIIMDYIDYIMDVVFSLIDNPTLQEWGMKLILKVANNTEADIGEALD